MSVIINIASNLFPDLTLFHEADRPAYGVRRAAHCPIQGMLVCHVSISYRMMDQNMEDLPHFLKAVDILLGERIFNKLYEQTTRD